MALSIAVEAKDALDKLWSACSIWGVFKQEEVASYITHASVHRNTPISKLVDLMIYRWEEYDGSRSQMQWTYGSPVSFFTGGMWDNPEKWPWKSGRAAVGINKPTLNTFQEEPEDWVQEWRKKNGMAPL